jgi:transposase InsO family protein
LQYYKILLSVLKLTLYRRHDNRTEFKGEVAQLCKELGIRVIRGRAYHPQTQGTVERANRTFKRRLSALQAQKGWSDWVALLAELALVINTTTTRALPRHKTPFDVWFGRRPRWITAGPIDDVDDEDQDLQDDTDDNDSDNDDDPVLSEIEARVVANNARLHA